MKTSITSCTLANVTCIYWFNTSVTTCLTNITSRRSSIICCIAHQWFFVINTIGAWTFELSSYLNAINRISTNFIIHAKQSFSNLIPLLFFSSLSIYFSLSIQQPLSKFSWSILIQTFFWRWRFSSANWLRVILRKLIINFTSNINTNSSYS